MRVRSPAAGAHDEVRLAGPVFTSRRSGLEPVPVALGADHSHPRRRENKHLRHRWGAEITCSARISGQSRKGAAWVLEQPLGLGVLVGRGVPGRAGRVGEPDARTDVTGVSGRRSSRRRDSTCVSVDRDQLALPEPVALPARRGARVRLHRVRSKSRSCAAMRGTRATGVSGDGPRPTRTEHPFDAQF